MQTADYPEVTDDFGHWLAGFIDGEGCFEVRRDRTGYAIRLAIAVRDDDRAALEEIRRRTGCGSLNNRPPRQDQTSPYNTRPQVKWVVHRKLDLLRVVTLLDEYPLRSKKRRDYLIWREAVLVWSSIQRRGNHGPGPGGCARFDWTPIEGFAQQLKRVRAYPG